MGSPISGDAVRVDQHLPAVGQSHDAQVESADLLEVFALSEHLVDHGAADVADTQAEDVQRLDLGFEEGLVHRLQCLALVLGVDDDGDVALGGALADGPDADAVAAQRAEGAPGDAALLAHTVAHEGHDGEAGFDHEWPNAAELLVGTEFFVERLDFCCPLVVLDRKVTPLAGPILGKQCIVDLGAAPGGWSQYCRRQQPAKVTVATGDDLLDLARCCDLFGVARRTPADTGQCASDGNGF